VVAAILVQLKRHSRYPERSRRKDPLSYAGPVFDATDGSVHHAAVRRQPVIA
jgi:hypothetical protein